MNHFPVVITMKRDDGFEAIAGLEMNSLLHGSLLLPKDNFKDSKIPQLNKLNPNNLHMGREALIHALAETPGDLVLDLHFTSTPNLATYSKSRIEIQLFIRGRGPKVEEIKEKIFAFYLTLKPILATHIPEAEFSPITDHNSLERCWNIFSDEKAISIERRREILNLEAPLKALSIGFNSESVIKQESDRVVRHIFPWMPSAEDWSVLLGAMMAQIDPAKIIIRIRRMSSWEKTKGRLSETISNCDKFISQSVDGQPTLLQQAVLIKKVSLKQLSRLTDGSFNLGVYLLNQGRSNDSLASVFGKAITGLRSRFDEADLWTGGFSEKAVKSNHVHDIHYFSDKEPFTISEAACAFRLPSPPIDEIPGLPVKRSRTSAAFLPNYHIKKDLICIAMNEHQGIRQNVEMSSDDRMRHTFIVGQTGTGKSTLMEHLCIQDIQAGRGLAVIDPHGEMVDSLIGRIPPDRAEDVILFDILDRERPFGFNLLQWKTIEERDLIIDELYTTMHGIYDLKSTGGPIFESNFRGMLKLLMGDKPRKDFTPTIVEFVLCYLDSDFRNYLQKGVEDQQILDFVRELERTGGDACLANLAPYITSKFARFTQDITLQRIVGQEKTSFDFEDVMNNGKILLLKLGKGRFGSIVSSLLANQIVSRFKLAAMKRGEMSPEKRRDFYLYVDECHNLPADNFMELLAEARKYRMGLILATQYTAQLSGSSPGSRNNLLAAILGNVGTTITYRLGQEDADKMSQALNPYFSSQDIIGLPNWCGYARLQVSNQAVAPFSFQNIKNDEKFNEDVAKKIKTLSRLKYGQDKTIIDAEINRRRSKWY